VGEPLSSVALAAWGAWSSPLGEGCSPAVAVGCPGVVVAEVVARVVADLVAVPVVPDPCVDAPDPADVAEVLRACGAVAPPLGVPPPVDVGRGAVLRGVLDVLDDGLGVGLGLGFGVDVELGAGGALLGAPPEPNANPITVPGAGS
jgi:hypothetical protein